MILFTILTLLAGVMSESSFEVYFTGETLRFDYYHTGDATTERLAPDEIKLEGAWPGSRTNLLDRLWLGKYYFEVYDRDSKTLIYSKGFASIYGEWETTGEAKQTWRSFEESQRFPEPRKPVTLKIKKRSDDGGYREIFSYDVDPGGRFVNRAGPPKRENVWTVFDNGPSAGKVDLLILGDGYTSGETAQYHKDVERLVTKMFETEPFKMRRKDFNVRAIDVVSAESGISNPRKNVWRNSALGLSFNSFDSDRYVLTYNNKTVRDVASQAPYDALIMIFNDRKYGGGGIYNLWATVSAHTEPSSYIFVHEFGHSFAGLGDEYYSSPVSYENVAVPDREPWEPNITALLDKQNLKWKHLSASNVPLPTPWNKSSYDQYDLKMQAKRAKLVSDKAPEEDLESLFREVKSVTSNMLKSEKYYGQVGAFEGAGYEPKGLYRPELDCIMFTRNDVPFCRVCNEYINKVIDTYTE